MALLMLLACGDAVTGVGASFEEYAGPAGRVYELRAPTVRADTGDTAGDDTAGATPTGPVRWLRADDGAWTLAEGDDVDTATVVATWTVRREAGLFVDDTRLLPERIVEGEKGGGVRVIAIAEWTTWYGTFPKAAELAVADGTWKGTQVFAEGVGPVLLTLDGASWETVWYE